MMITSISGSISCMRRCSSTPSVPGILMSTSAKSKRFAAILARASWALSATVTS